ncbi:hypothetical protein [Corynebacterium sp. HMSC28B08]|uniref:hypothetical protein n=1 Tax=Corynebacterium sp. HMSC28B08 TaxID=1581066 RepID=UPI0008A54EF4|nr:hypothetical protein [Corynebacterium sp. HMSC28B08]OFT90678.1 hypothetical protein HMPREF3098_02700 [Corynebacterium sp. HMSC28B08]
MASFYLVAALVALLTVGARGFQLSQRGLFWDDLVIPSFYSGFNPVGGQPTSAMGENSPLATPPGVPGVPPADPASAQFAAEQLRSALGKTIPDAHASLPERLFTPYDGHLMPGTSALQLAVSRADPLSWHVPAVLIFGLTIVLAIGWFLVARRAIQWGASPGLALIVYTAACVSPFLSSATGWWSAAINALAWQLAAVGILLVGLRTKNGTVALSIAFTGIQLTALLFTEKALSLVAIIATVTWVRAQVQRQPRLLRATIAPAVLTVAWAAWYLSVAGFHDDSEGFAVTTAVPKALATLVLPGMIGGPWVWDRWHPGSPFADLALGIAVPLFLVIVTGLLYLAWRVLSNSTRSTRRAMRVLAMIVGASFAYLAAVLVVMVRARTSTGTTDLLPRTPHYYADWWTFTLVVVLLGGIALSSRRPSDHPPAIPTGRRFSVAAMFLAISATISTVTWTMTWQDDPTREYLANLRQTVVDPQRAGTLSPLLSQPARIDVLSPLLHPFNSINAIAGVPVATHTTQPKVVDDSGRLVDAGVLRVASNKKGTEPQCGTRITAGKPRVVVLDQPLPFGDWTWEFNAAATQDAQVRISMPNGLQSASEVSKRAVTVPVGTELQTQWVRINGVGGTIALEVQGAEGTSVCLGEGAIGPLLPVQQ